ncbi:MAG: hypothetical protein ACI9CD_000663 [Candidatus Deianiraeaceae bacterium]|jgi:hypothetical protein
MHLMIDTPINIIFKSFLKVSQEEDVSFAEFITNYDIESGTILSLTLNFELSMLQIMKMIFNDFSQTFSLSGVNKISTKIQILVDGYFKYIVSMEIDVSVKKILLYMRNNCMSMYWAYIKYIANEMWNYTYVYDEDYNFITRRMKLYTILHARHSDMFN